MTVLSIARFTLILGSCAALAASARGQNDAPGTQPAATDEPGAIWAPAAPNNFEVAKRPEVGSIDYVVIHDIEGSAEGAVRWFQNPMANVSAHYTIDGAGKRIWQQVRERDIGYHAGNRDINHRSIGIEHEGYAYRPGFFNYGQYEASARLVRSITKRYNIPRDRTRIIAHAEVPHPTDPSRRGGRSGHTDPGPYWDWEYYIALVRNDARLERVWAPRVIRPGEKVQVTATWTNMGDDPWPLHNGRRSDAVQQRGPVYLGVRPQEPVRASVGSPLYDRSWTSPRYAAPPRGPADVAPGETGTFAFTVLAPRTLGTLQEQFRLTKVPVVPQVPAPFGAPLLLSLRVEPWSIVQEAVAPAFTAPGWNVKPAGDRALLWRRVAPGAAAAPARWDVSLPITGEWEVFARWDAGRNRTSRAVYEVSGAEKPRKVVVDQRRKSGWHSLGKYRFTGAKPAASVALTAAPGSRGILVADAVRLVGPWAE